MLRMIVRTWARERLREQQGAELLGSVEDIAQVLRMTVYVNAAAGFTEHSKVADGASERLVELLGERGAAVRSAVGVASLPGNACVEIELTCARA